ncbi:MAG: hypothetical protein AAFW74_04575, partial [Pseudomonadota bacterium]
EFGQFNHGQAKLSGKPINSLLGYPREMLKALEEEGLIVPGDPCNSRFLKTLEPTGRMYRVFTDDEIKLWRKWIEWRRPGTPIADQLEDDSFTASELQGYIDWLANYEVNVAKGRKKRKEPTDEDKTIMADFLKSLEKFAAGTRIESWLEKTKQQLEKKRKRDVRKFIMQEHAMPWLGSCMVRVLNSLAMQQADSHGHDRVTLDDPDDPDGGKVSLSELFSEILDSIDHIEPERRLLRALAGSKWITSGSPDTSQFFNELLSGTRPMGRAFGSVIPGNDGFTATDTMVQWIKHKCVIPEPHPHKRRAAGLDLSEDEELHHITGMTYGMPCLH